MARSIDDEVNRLAAAAAGLGIRPRVFLRNHERLFRGVGLSGKTVLDVGSGIGLASLYAAARGAARVVAIEPEAAGSQDGALDEARSITAAMGYEDRVEIVPATLEGSHVAGRFDIVLMGNMINHFDAEACAVLDRDPAAREAYRPLFERVAALCRPGGTIIVTDCSNRNFFPDLGLRHPLIHSINWRIHQPPELWAEMFLRFGFRRPRIDWLPLARMGWLGRLLGTRRPIAYFLNSHFRLVLEKGPNSD